MALTYNAQTRRLDLKGTITFSDLTTKNITCGDILSYSISEQAGSEGLPLGTTEAATYNLSLSNVGRIYTPSMLDNAKIAMQIGIEKDGAFVYSDFGEWFVQDVMMPEQSVAIDISGFDALGSRFSAEYADDPSAYPTTIGSLASTMCGIAGVFLDSSSFPNAAVQIKKMPEWPEGVTARDIIGYCAACAGGFARMGRNGKLQIVPYAGNAVHALNAGLYSTFTPTGGQGFRFNCIEARLSDDDEEYTRYAVDGNIADNPTNTIQTDGNPLMTEAIVQSLVSELRGFHAAGASVNWVGDPAVQCGDMVDVTTLDGTVTRILVNAQTFTFNGGLSAMISCNLPTLNMANSAAYSTGSSVFDANGNIKVTRIPGLDNKIVSATAGHFSSLTADTVTADVLLSALISAVQLRAQQIDASSIDTDSLTAAIAEIINATIRKLNAGTISTDTLYAALAEIVALRVGSITAETIDADKLYAALANVIDLRAGSVTADTIDTDELAAAVARIVALRADTITAGSIETDELGAALAKVIALYAQVGDFDFATVQNLVSKALSLEQGAMESVYIRNLAVTSANLISATLGKLVLKGADGGYYEVFVGSDGAVSAAPVEVSEGEIAAGATDGGRQIVETSLNVGDLNATNLQASSAVINQILTTALTAEKITAADAMIASATIPALYATSIQAIGNSLDLRANESVKLAVGDAVDGVDERINGVYSEVTQRADGLEAQLIEKVDGETLRAYIRYDGENVEIGRSDSRYRTQTSDRGFVILQDGAEMTSMEQNAVTAPVFRARRTIEIGGHVMKLGSAGHLIIN